MKEIIDKVDFIQIKNFCYKSHCKRVQREDKALGKIWAKHINDKGLVFRK